MKNLNVRTSLQKKLALVALTGAVTLPLLATTTAQADPPKHAPAWGQRDKDGKPGKNDRNNGNRNNNGRDNDGRDRDGRDNNGFDRNGFDRNGYDRNGRDRSGYDKSGYNSGGYNKGGYDRNGYDRNGRDRNGRNRPGNNGGRPNWGTTNPGGWNNGNIGNNGNYGSSATIVGTVIDSQNQANTLRVRADNGRVYTVPTGNARYFFVGNRVRVSGRLNGTTLIGASVSRQ